MCLERTNLDPVSTVSPPAGVERMPSYANFYTRVVRRTFFIMHSLLFFKFLCDSSHLFSSEHSGILMPNVQFRCFEVAAAVGQEVLSAGS